MSPFPYSFNEHVLGISNCLSPLGRERVSCHHRSAVLRYVSCSYCMVLGLSKPAFWSDVNVQGLPHFFLCFQPPVGVTI